METHPISADTLKALQTAISSHCKSHKDILRCWICVLDLQSGAPVLAVLLDSYQFREHQEAFWNIVQDKLQPGFLAHVIDPEEPAYVDVIKTLRGLPPVYDATKSPGFFGRLVQSVKINPIPYISIHPIMNSIDGDEGG